jgi:hypothetical protein
MARVAARTARAIAADAAEGFSIGGRAVVSAPAGAKRASGWGEVVQRRQLIAQHECVLLPQRLLMAMALSAWVVSLLTLSAIVGARWLDAALGEAMAEAAAVSGQLGSRATNWRFGIAPAWRLPALAVGQVLTLLPAPTVALVRRYLLLGLQAAALLIAAASAIGWWLSVRNYRRQMIWLRRGEPRFERFKYSIAAVGRYIGFQVVHTVVGWLALACVLLALALPAAFVALAAPSIGLFDERIYFAASAGARAMGVRLATAAVLPLVFQAAMDRFVFVHGGWFRHRLFHSLYDYNFIYCNVRARGARLPVARMRALRARAWRAHTRAQYGLGLSAQAVGLGCRLRLWVKARLCPAARTHRACAPAAHVSLAVLPGVPAHPHRRHLRRGTSINLIRSCSFPARACFAGASPGRAPCALALSLVPPSPSHTPSLSLARTRY